MWQNEHKPKRRKAKHYNLRISKNIIINPTNVVDLKQTLLQI
jgi:hypothetical protein